MGQRVLVSREVSEAKVGAAAGAAAASLQALQLASSAEATRRPFCSGRSVLAARADPPPMLCIPPFPALSGTVPRALLRGRPFPLSPDGV